MMSGVSRSCTIFLLCLTVSFGGSLDALAHGDGHEHSPAEYLALYRSLLSSIRESTEAPRAGAEVPYFFYGDGARGPRTYYYFSGDAVSRIIQTTVERMPGGHDSDEPGTRTSGPGALARQWLIGLGRFGLELPSIVVEGMRQYGASFVVYTVLAESIEHFFIPHPALCKILQAAYFSTAGPVFSFVRVARSGVLEPAGLGQRIRAGVLAARLELYFKWKARSRVFRADPALSGLSQSDYLRYLESVEDEAGFAREYLAGTFFWAETAPGLVDPSAMAGIPSRLPEPGLMGQLDELQSAETTEQGLWMAFRLASFFQLFKDLLGASSTDTLLSTWPRPGIDPRPYLRFGSDYWHLIKIKSLLGSIGKLLDLYKSELFALAASRGDSQLLRERTLALERFAENGLVPLLTRAARLGDLSVEAAELGRLGKATSRLTRALRGLGRSPAACAWAFRTAQGEEPVRN